MKLKLFTTVALISSLNAVEIRLGNGTFEWEMGITKFMNTSFDLNINTITISETHKNFGNNKLYYFYNADIYSSDFVDQITTLISYPITYDFPVFGSANDAIDNYTPIPTPSTYKVRGFDLNLGLGYDIYREKNNFHGSYSVIDLGVTYAPLPQYPKLHVTLGYSKKNWSMDDVTADMFNLFEVESNGMLSSEFSSSSAYLGVGYSF